MVLIKTLKNTNKKCKTVIGFGDVIADMFSNEKLYLIVTEFS